MHDLIQTKKHTLFTEKKILLSAFLLCFCGMVFSFYLKSDSDTDTQKKFTVSIIEQPSLARGNGKITAVNHRILSANESGIVEKIFVKQGQSIEVGQPLIQINNPTLLRESREAEFTANEVIAQTSYQHSQLDLELEALRSDLARSRSVLKGVQLELRANEKLKESGIISKVKFEQLKLTAEQAQMDVNNLEHRLTLMEPIVKSQQDALLAQQQAATDRVLYFRKRIDSLIIESPIAGVLRELPITQGEAVTEGSKLLDIVDNTQLVAEITVPQYLGDKIRESYIATVETPNGQISGQVEFVDPIVRQGAVLVRIQLPNDLPHWLTMEQSVKAAINMSTPMSIASVERPDFYTDEQAWEIHHVIDGQRYATDIKVISANNDSLVLDGELQSGDQIVFVPIAKQSVWFN